jgi:cbb3-type cytochrome oxidase subunit 3
VIYITQYYLTINSDHGNPTGQGWYDKGTTAHFAVLSQDTTTAFATYTFTTWTGIGEGSYTGTGNIQSVVMNNPITETATWEQTAILYTVAESALILFLLIILALLLYYADRRRRKKKAQAQMKPTFSSTIQ